MIRDEDLKSSIDYSEGQKKAAHRVLVELVNIFREYEEEIRIVGGWVPDLMFPGEGHVGSVDVDVLINHLTLEDGIAFEFIELMVSKEVFFRFSLFINEPPAVYDSFFCHHSVNILIPFSGKEQLFQTLKMFSGT